MAISALALSGAIADIVGREHVLSDSAGLSAYAVDGLVPRWVGSPANVEQMGRLLALASTEELAVAPRGSGSSLSLGNPPRRLDMILDCRRLNAIIEYVPEDLVASVQCGIPLSALAARLSQHGQRLPLDPLGPSSRTVGGVLATNASGPLRFRYGAGRDLLLGVRFVQSDGTITWGGAKVVKSVTGYDVPKLMVGSLGSLGVIAEATLRLHPIPPATGSWLYGFDSLAGSADFLKALLGSTLEPDRVVALNAEALERAGQPASRVAVAVSLSSVPEAVASQGEALGRLATEHGVRSITPAQELWNALSMALEGPVVLRLASEVSRLVFWLGEIGRLAAEMGGRMSAVGEAGNGVLWASVLGPRPDGSWNARVLTPLRDGVAREGGSVVVERAPAELKSQVDVWGPMGPEALAIMRRLKAEFDPRSILNPGRFVGAI